MHSNSSNKNNKPELYHVMKDPDETNKLADSRPEKVKHLKKRIREWWNEAIPG
ncbi:MAG: hypothetical protein ACQER7_05390 [Bacteroidota bacterium]